jgi:hypothetical protein
VNLPFASVFVGGPSRQDHPELLKPHPSARIFHEFACNLFAPQYSLKFTCTTILWSSGTPSRLAA